MSLEETSAVAPDSAVKKDKSSKKMKKDKKRKSLPSSAAASAEDSAIVQNIEEDSGSAAMAIDDVPAPAAPQGGEADGKQEDEEEEEVEVEAISHAEARKRRKLLKMKEKEAEEKGITVEELDAQMEAARPKKQLDVENKTKKDDEAELAGQEDGGKKQEEVNTATQKKSQHGVWVGNLSFRTNAERVSLVSLFT